MWVIWYFYEEDTPPRLLVAFSDEIAARMAELELIKSADKDGDIRYAHHRFNRSDMELHYVPLWRDD